MGEEAAAFAPAIRSRKQRPTNPLQAGIQAFIQNHPHLGQLSTWPKRYTIYTPLLLLPVNFTNHSPDWGKLYASLSSGQRSQLFQHIVTAFSNAGQSITHIAVNAPIALDGYSLDNNENVIRSPSGLLPVWGDFGPDDLRDGDMTTPTGRDFDEAFWITTTQDHGVSQCWAPRYTMFSHGNLSEKRRILATTDSTSRPVFSGKTSSEIIKMQVLDLYIGIGYFALCYLARGVDRVWGWDLNPWSIEGLRRGCEANGWRCMVLCVDNDGECDPTLLRNLVAQLSAGRSAPLEHVRCVAFVGDNKWARKVIGRVAELYREAAPGPSLFVPEFDHINLGLLPSSTASWPSAVSLVARRGTMHIHENIKSTEAETRSSEIEQSISQLLGEHRGGGKARLLHTEQVKTYAPGVMHCVVDIEVVDM
jgi:tRNA wybutosine-synthesizing protein 2